MDSVIFANQLKDLVRPKYFTFISYEQRHTKVSPANLEDFCFFLSQKDIKRLNFSVECSQNKFIPLYLTQRSILE